MALGVLQDLPAKSMLRPPSFSGSKRIDVFWMRCSKLRPPFPEGLRHYCQRELGLRFSVSQHT